MTEHDRTAEIIRLKDQAPFESERRETALLVNDEQRYFVSPDYLGPIIFAIRSPRPRGVKPADGSPLVLVAFGGRALRRAGRA